VLELNDVSLQVGSGVEETVLLSEISATLPQGHFAAVLGPSGCGKSTLLKVIAGLLEHTMGRVKWDGRDLAEEGDLDPHEIGYVPQFSIAYERLTVWENVQAALRLRVAGLTNDEEIARLDTVLQDVGLSDINDRPVRLLSGGQRRRLALALELVSAPHLLLCDEVTSGLDPKAEDEVVRLVGRLPEGSRYALWTTGDRPTKVVDFTEDRAVAGRALKRVELTVYADNEPAIRLYTSHGFEVEGRHVKAGFTDGQYHDLLTMARLRF